MFIALDAIDQILVDLDNESLTVEQITELESQLVNARANFDETYGDLFEEYKDDKNSLMGQAKEDSKQALETIKSQYRTRVQNNKQNTNNAKNNSNNVRNRIKTWQQEQENLD